MRHLRHARPWLGATTAVDAVAERYLDDVCRAGPLRGNRNGHRRPRLTHDHRLLPRRCAPPAPTPPAARCANWTASPPADDVDVVSPSPRCGNGSASSSSCTTRGLDVGELNVIASPLQSMRDVFDLMPTDTDDDWRTISERLSRVPDRVAGYADGIARGGGGRPPARGSPGGARDRAGRADPAAVRRHGGRRAHRTTTRCMPNCRRARRRPPTRTAGSPRCSVTRSARTPAAIDAFGRDAYRLFSRLYLGAAVDLDETYEWGLDLLQCHCGRTGVDRPPALSRVVGRPKRCAGWTRSHATSCTAPTRCGTGCRSCPTVPSMHWPTRISRSPNRCATWNAGSRRRRPAASTTPARRRT